MREISPEELSKILDEHADWEVEERREGERADLSNDNLINVELSGTLLNYASLSGANLSDASLNYADLKGANLSRADLGCANLCEANLTQVKNLSINQLSKAKTLYEAKLDPELKKQVREKYPHLLKKPVEEEEEDEE